MFAILSDENDFKKTNPFAEWLRHTSTKIVFCLSVLSLAAVAGAAPEPNAADNTVQNQTDLKSNVLNPFDQWRGSSQDLEVTRKIRSTLVADNSLSTYAHNIKVITVNGRTVLRGPVRSRIERKKVSTIARSVVGYEHQLDNQLTIAN